MILRDQEEKKRKEDQKNFHNPNTIKRLTMRQIEIVKHEFTKNRGLTEGEREKPRNLQIIDRILRVLKYFKRYNEDVRMKIYQNAEFVSLPAQTVIFN